MVLVAVTVHGQMPSPAFEVASVKPNKSGNGVESIANQPGGRIALTNVPLRAIITLAFQLQDFQIADGPAWIATDRFDIIAKAPAGTPIGPLAPVGAPTPMHLMMRALLADRFGLKSHMDTREMPIYSLVMTRADRKPGPGLVESKADCAALARTPGAPLAPPKPGERPTCGFMMAPGHLMGGGVPIAQL